MSLEKCNRHVETFHFTSHLFSCLADFLSTVESGCLLPSLPTDLTYDQTSGIGFICDLNDNVAAPWSSAYSGAASTCNKSMYNFLPSDYFEREKNCLPLQLQTSYNFHFPPLLIIPLLNKQVSFTLITTKVILQRLHFQNFPKQHPLSSVKVWHNSYSLVSLAKNFTPVAWFI